ncbi:uncharacterized protein LOC143901780 [Temnothorax americanus]|uniref:uncharacterized protein LOC143901780 n=1 Tax=Temnothorax americanus TaxID=1964332 RepID=UPI0040682442
MYIYRKCLSDNVGMNRNVSRESLETETSRQRVKYFLPHGYDLGEVGRPSTQYEDFTQTKLSFCLDKNQKSKDGEALTYPPSADLIEQTNRSRFVAFVSGVPYKYSD